MTPVADPSLSKVASQPNGEHGSSTMSFAIVVGNAGPSTAADITVTDVVPAGLNAERDGRAVDGEQHRQQRDRARPAAWPAWGRRRPDHRGEHEQRHERDAGLHQHSQRDQHHAGPDADQQHRHGDGDIAPLADVATVVSLPANATAGTVVTAR